jgi:hypothetical protein
MHHLVLELLKQGSTGSDTTSSPPNFVDESTGPEISSLAQTCEDAAVFMLNGCSEILQADLLLDNMCLVQLVNPKS